MLLYDIGKGDIFGMDSVTVDEPGETIRLWIVQIGNSQYVVTTQTGASADPDDVRVLEKMVESITWGRERS